MHFLACSFTTPLTGSLGGLENISVKNLRTVISLFFLMLLLAPVAAFSNDASIEGLKVDMAPPARVSFLVKDAFTKDIEDAISSGIPTSFTFFVEFNRVKDFWFNERLGKWVFRHTVKYDSLKEEYVVNLDESENVIRTKDFNEMKRLMVTGDSINLTPIAPLEAGEYEWRVKAELHAIKLPFLLNYMLFFVKYWDFETNWYIYGFTL